MDDRVDDRVDEGVFREELRVCLRAASARMAMPLPGPLGAPRRLPVMAAVSEVAEAIQPLLDRVGIDDVLRALRLENGDLNSPLWSKQAESKVTSL